jgi:pimeloyl-ACP methyl ester carboxylesterase
MPTGRVVWHVWGQGRPLVLLHGGAGSWTHWLRNIEPLAAAGWRVYVPDMPGCGESDSPPDAETADADALVEPIAQGLRRLFDGRAVPLAGFSFGSRVGGMLAEQHPQLVARLVIVGGPVLPRVGQPPVLTSWRHLPTEAERMAAHRANLAAMMLAREESITPLATGLQAGNATRDRLRKRNSGRMEQLEHVLMRVRCPIHAIYGSEDVFYRERFPALRAAFDRMPAFAGLTVLQGSGHWVAFEDAEGTNAALLRALEG